jgi:hypothetical protein
MAASAACSAPVAAYRETSKNCRIAKRTHRKGPPRSFVVFSLYYQPRSPLGRPIFGPGTAAASPTPGSARGRGEILVPTATKARSCAK